jgi:DNA polymerase III delta prime subunit
MMAKEFVQGKNTKKEKALISAGKIIRLYSDPAVKVLKDYILSDFKDGEVDDLFGIYDGFIVLVEDDYDSAQEVIANTAMLVRNIEPDITFTWTDLVGESLADFDQIILGRIYNLVGQSEDNPFTINIFENLSAYLQLAAKGEAVNLKKIVNELRDIHTIFIIREKELPLFNELVDRDNTAIKIWLSRQPSDLDLHYLERTDIGSWSEQAVVDESIYTESAKLLIKKARQISELWGDDSIDSHSLLLAAAEGSETGLAIAQCLNLSLDTLRHLRADREWKLIRDGEITGYPFDISGIDVIKKAIKLASVEGYPDRYYPGLVNNYHLVCAIAMNSKVRIDLEIKREFTFENALNKLAEWYHNKYVSPSIDRGSSVYRFMFPYQGLHRELMGHIFGQDQALDAIFEYLCNDEIAYGGHSKKNIPPAALLFSGPTGVGKAHLAATLAAELERPFLHLDLAVYESVSPLPLLKFVQMNWKAILYFENIDQANPEVLNTICRILDHGKVYDEHMAKRVDFYNTLILFSTTIPVSEFQRMPKALLSRIKRKQIISFNELEADHLINVTRRKFNEYAKTVEINCEKTLTYDPLVPYCLLFHEGGKPKAGEISSAVEDLVGSQIQKFTNCFTPDSGEHLLADYGKLHFTVGNLRTINRETKELFIPGEKPKILLLANRGIAGYLCRSVQEAEWITVQSLDEMAELAERTGTFDYALIDLWFNIDLLTDKINLLENFSTVWNSHTSRLPQPLLAQKLFNLEQQKLIAKINKNTPIIMLNVLDMLWGKYACEEDEQPVSCFVDVADELRKFREQGLSFYPYDCGQFQADYFLHFISSLGARGILNAVFDAEQDNASDEQYSLTTFIEQIRQRLHYEKMAGEIASHQEYLSYKPVWTLDASTKTVFINLDDLQLLKG